MATFTTLAAAQAEITRLDNLMISLGYDPATGLKLPPPPPPPVPSWGPATSTALGQVTIPWANVTPLKIGRDGVDKSGFGAWDTSMDTVTLNSWLPSKKAVFTNLVSGATYSFSLYPTTGAPASVGSTTPAPMIIKFTVPAVVVPPPAAITVKEIAVPDGTLEVGWNFTPTSVGRNGVDINGVGAFTTAQRSPAGLTPAELAAGKMQFLGLVSGATYTITVNRAVGAALTTTFTMAGSLPAPPAIPATGTFLAGVAATSSVGDAATLTALLKHDVPVLNIATTSADTTFAHGAFDTVGPWLAAQANRKVIWTVDPLTDFPGQFTNTAVDTQMNALATHINAKISQYHFVSSQVIIRFARESNGNWGLPWQPRMFSNNYAAFITMWRRVHNGFRVICPGALWDWSIVPTMNAGTVTDFVACYPGDGYVDILGMVVYDDNGSTFGNFAPAQARLQYATTFADAHALNKAIDESALCNPAQGKGGNGDNPAFETGMLAFATSHKFLYRVYVNANTLETGATLASYPNSLAADVAWWGGNGAPSFGPAVYNAAAGSVTVPFANVVPIKIGRDGTDTTGYGAYDTTQSAASVLANAIATKQFVFTSMNVPGFTFTFTLTPDVSTVAGTVTPGTPMVTKLTIPGTPVTPPSSGTMQCAAYDWGNNADWVAGWNSLYGTSRGGKDLGVCSLYFAPASDDINNTFNATTCNWLAASASHRVLMGVNMYTDAPYNFADAKVGQVQNLANGILAKASQYGFNPGQVLWRDSYEANGPYNMPWEPPLGNADSPAVIAQWIAAWRARAIAVKLIDARFKFVFNVVPWDPGPSSWNNMYPGDDVVDYVSGDGYDDYQYTGSVTGDTNGHITRFSQVRDFANAHGKGWGIDESALCRVGARGDANAHGDNPDWIRLWRWARDNGASWCTYFNVSVDETGMTLADAPNFVAQFIPFLATLT